MNLHEVPVLYNQSNDSFEMFVEGKRAFIDFSKKGDTIYLLHTEVPEELEGKGVAAAMVQKVFQFLEDHHYRLVPSCSYVQYFLKRNPDWIRLVK